jgi:hypothetical protein
MWEYASVSRSSYDPDALVAALNERAAEGWEVVAIVPRTDGQLTGFLKREGSGSSTGATSSATSSSTSTPSTSSTTTAAEPAAAAIEAPAEAPSAWSPGTTAEPASTSSGGNEWSSTSSAGAPAANASPPSAPSSEPAGWAAAPERTTPIAPIEPTPAPQPAAAPVSQPATPANWYPDPSGRFELRYWNGTAWTEHVSRGGVQYTDPPTA